LKIAAQRTGETLDGAWLVGDNADTAVAAAAAAGIKGCT
jgi:FMN phosphatase YigB (HAD superfamily)